MTSTRPGKFWGIAAIAVALAVGPVAAAWITLREISWVKARVVEIFEEKTGALIELAKETGVPIPADMPTTNTEGEKTTPPEPQKKLSKIKSRGKEVNPKVEYLRDRGVAKANQGNYSEGIAFLVQALELEPDNHGARQELSLILNARGWSRLGNDDLEEAANSFDEALMYWSENPEAMRGKGYIHFYNNDRGQAEEWLERYIKAGGKQSEGYNLLAKIYYDSDRLDEALSILQKSLALNPRQPEVKKMIAKVRQELEIEQEFQTTETSHFLIKYEGREVPEISLIVMVVCEQAYSEVGARLGYYPKNPVMVLLYTNEQFQDVTESPAWAGGIFDGKIRIPVKGLKERTNLLDKLIYHEFTHAVIFEYTHANAPVWLHEGLAQMSEDRKYVKPRAAQLLLSLRGPVPLQYLEGSFMKLTGPGAAAAYIESWFAATYIEEAYGPYAIRSLLSALEQGADMNTAMKLCLHVEYWNFNIEFTQWLEEQAEN